MKVDLILEMRWWGAEERAIDGHYQFTYFQSKSQCDLMFDLTNICICERHQSLKATGKQDFFVSSLVVVVA